ncbi:hypothetical protein GA0115253_103985 [Streptomyces sp. Termitarium-T10T-6]|nr:hypothetical protein GA0115253_103985 [Streptomyces sp. Termitarium-T10T-6]
MVRYGEFLATTTMSGSSVSRAIGVVSARVLGDLLVWTAPTTPRPMESASLPLPCSPTSRVRPTVPPAPGRLNTSMLWVSPASSAFLAMVRAVMS